MKNLMIGSALALATVMASPAAADVVLVSASSLTNDNVLFNFGDQSANVITGRLNNTASTSLTFTGAGGSILRAGGGQARITGDLDASTRNPNDTIELNGFTFGLTDNSTFSNVELNLFKGSASAVTFRITDDMGDVFTFANLALGNGENRFGFEAIAGQSIRSVAFATIGGGIQDVRQVRLGLNAGTGNPGNPDAVPEPATWAMMLGGFGLLGAAARRRTRATYVSA